MAEKHFLHEGKKINYRIYGEGLPVLLLHGFAEDHSVWDQQASHLQHKNRLIIPDLPGSGASDTLATTTMETLAASMKALLDVEGVQQAVILGHSMGGYVALAFAEAYPEAVLGLGLVHSTTYADSDEKVQIRRKGIAFIKEHGTATFIKTTTPNLFSDITKRNKPELAENFINSLPSFTNEALIAYYEAMIARKDRTPLLTDLKIPFLFVIGKYDNAVPCKDSLAQAALPDRSFVSILENAGHMGMIEETDTLNEVLGEYLNDVAINSR